MTSAMRDAVRERLRELTDQNGGTLTPQMVVDDARESDSPLHMHFEWDIAKAAQGYWLEQARVLIRSVRIVMHDHRVTVSVPEYLRDPSADSGEQGYVSISRIATDTDKAREAVVNEFSRAAAVMRRAREIAIALSLDAEVDDIVDRIEQVKTRAQEHVSP